MLTRTKGENIHAQGARHPRTVHHRRAGAAGRLTNHLPPHVTQGGQPGTMEPGEGYGLGVSVTVDPAAAANLGSRGAFGWSGVATSWFTVDPEEKLVAVLLAQQFPYDGRLLKEFQTLVYQAISD
jgi:CubicO group peptidase (beta-lactamase class C family)